MSRTSYRMPYAITSTLRSPRNTTCTYMLPSDRPGTALIAWCFVEAVSLLRCPLWARRAISLLPGTALVRGCDTGSALRRGAPCVKRMGTQGRHAGQQGGPGFGRIRRGGS